MSLPSSTLSPASTSAFLSDDKHNASSPQAQGRNPIALRLYKILGTNFDDVATREALQTLSELYSQGSTLKERLPDSSVEGTEENESGSTKKTAASTTVSHELAMWARKNLRRDMENKLAEGSQQFLKVLREVNEKVEELQKHVDMMRASCNEAEAHLERTRESSKDLLQRAASLREERKETETMKLIATLFLDRFTLTNDELEAVTERDVPVGQRFFAAMDKAEQIREDCRLLMGGEDGPTQAGMDIMASTSSHLEQGYDKIFRWCSNEFRQLSRDVHYDVNPILRECVQRLRKRPELLTEALTVLSETRQATLLTLFTTALTRGGPSGLPRPIELHAHDPMRYVGDMLAWVHQAIAAEREFLESLFGLRSDGRMVGSVRKFDESTEEEEWMGELMDISVGKLCVPLKVRVQQTVRSQESSIVSYKVVNLLQFYLLTMRRTLGDDAAVSKALEEITNVAYKVFFDSIEAQGRALLRISLEADDPSLSPPLGILDHCQILREIMSVYQSSLLGDEDETTRVSGFQKVLDIMVDPVVETIVSRGEEKKRVRPKWDHAVYVLNSLAYLQSVLEPFEFTAEKQNMIQGVVEGKIGLLIHEHYENIMSDAGLKQAAEICQTHQRQEPLSHVPGMEPTDLQKSLRQFSIWLSEPEVVHSTRLSRLTGQRYHARIHQAALERMAQAYRLICEEVRKVENKYEAASTLLGGERPFGQIHLLWQIFGLEEETPA
ncbi:hypothetical protein AX17_001841 [Amanita inopinata Kibby_2008]|nr:hypothetical protein AX17_001841 [Amanita inopinata Kibby_2008]